MNASLKSRQQDCRFSRSGAGKRSDGKKAVCNFAVEIDNLEHLERLIKRLDQLDGVIEVKRVGS